jgi:uncharacterized protein (TIGR03067 family)
MRTITLLLVSLGSLAFAPAPFPRTHQREGGDDLTKLQGTWMRTSLNGKPEKNTLVSIKGDRMDYGTSEDVWVVTVDMTKMPKRIDFVRVDGKMTFRGVYRLEGDTFTYSLLMNVAEAERPLDFNLNRPNAWVGVYKRQKP